jgi:hypothetical protein
MFVRDFDQIRALAQGLRTIDCSRVDLGRLRHIASGTYNDVFSYDLPASDKAVLRLSYYNKSTIQRMEDLIVEKKRTGGPEYSDRKSQAYKQLMVQARNVCSTDSVWIKIHFSDLTNFLVKNNVSPHFVYTLSSKDCKKALEHISKALPINTLKNRLDAQSSCHTRYNNISFQEPFDMDVTRALKRARNPQDAFRMTDDDLRSIVFQVLFTLATLQHYVPMFRHNDISTNNVLLKRMPMNTNRFTYQLYDMRFQLVGPRLFAAIHDFDLAHADAYIMHMGGDRARFSLQNKVVMKRGFKGNATGAGAIAPDYDPSFDAYFFLRVLRGQISGQSAAYPQTHAWLKHELMVDKYPLKYLQTVDPTFVPVNLLRSNYFNALRDPPSSAPAMFGPRQLELDVHVGGQPVYSNIEQRITGTQTMPILSDRSNKRVAFVDHNGLFVVTRPLETRWKRLILKFYDVPQETDMTGEDGAFRHDAAIAYQACESEDPAALEWLARKLGVPTTNKDAKVLCADLREAVQSKWYGVDPFDEYERVIHPRCPSFFTDEDILDYAKAVGVPEEDLYVPNLVDFDGNKVPMSRGELCLLAFAAATEGKESA